jgi:hypothetical protein
MALKIYDSNQDPIATLQHGYVDGVSGGVYEFQVFVRNEDVTKYYTGVQLKYLVDGEPDWYDPATSRTTVRMSSPAVAVGTGTQPTTTDWAGISPTDTITVSTGNIGNDEAPSLLYYPVWIRVFVPGKTEAQTLRHGLRVVATEHVL